MKNERYEYIYYSKDFDTQWCKMIDECFNNDVFPELLRHPCNCEIILHSDNIAKKWRRYIDKDNISLNNLFEKIKCFKGNWKEQKICLKLIEEYTNGKRYKRKD